MMNLIVLFTIVIQLIKLDIFVFSSIDFDRSFVGVNFSPYVKKNYNLYNELMSPCPNEITVTELKAMLLVVATKFSRVCTETVGAWDVPNVDNETYYDSACIIARTAEVAAKINKENDNKTLSVVIGIMTYDDEFGGTNRSYAEIDTAVEAGLVANTIYPGTVEGFQIFVNVGAINDTYLANTGLIMITYLKKLWRLKYSIKTMERLLALQKNKSKNTKMAALEAKQILDFVAKCKNVKIGVMTEIKDFKNIDLQQYNRAEHFHFGQPHVKLVFKSDFVSVKLLSSNAVLMNGPADLFSYITRPVDLYGDASKTIGPDFEIMEITGWPSIQNSTMQNLEEMRTYWSLFNDFASKNNFTIWLNEAFDNPWKKSLGEDLPHYGWWRLTEDNLAHDTSAYVEKILEKVEKTADHPSNISTYTSWVVGITGFAILALLIITFSIYIFKKIRSLKDVLTQDEMNEFLHGFTATGNPVDMTGNWACWTALKTPYDRKLEIPKERLEIYWDEFLGAGEFGSVHRAIINDMSPKQVALKTTKTGCSAIALKGILSEIKILAQLGQHSNIVSIIGAYTAEIQRGKVYLALELCEMGSLKTFLTDLYTRAGADERFSNDIKHTFLQWSCDIATGMEHIGRKGVIHADLATRNVLLTRNGVAKVSDFGLSRRLYEYSEYVKRGERPVPWRWMALESLRLNQFSHQSDVWSYGITLWEIFSLGAEPYLGYSYNADFIESLENGSAMLSSPCEASTEIFELMLDCWQLQPDMRPSFSHLKTRIWEMLNKDND